MARITLTISEDEQQALLKLSQQERRNPRDQGALLLRQALEEVGVLRPAVIGAAAASLAMSPSQA